MGRSATNRFGSMSQPQPSDPVEDHFRTVEAVPPLTDFEERALWEAVRGGEGAEEGRRRLIEANLRLVAPIAVRYEGRGVAFADLVQEGNIALVRAVELFDPSGGQRFTSFASQQIDHDIARAVG